MRTQEHFFITTPEGIDLKASFKWTTSRARDTHGYNICSLIINNQKVSSCKGGGYDMEGTALADWLVEQEKGIANLKQLTANYGSNDNGTGFYGLWFWDTRQGKRVKKWSPGCSVGLDGGCGINSIKRIAIKLGYQF